MNRCRQIRRDLATYRELGARARARVDAHLDTCSACAARLARYQQQDRTLAALPLIKPAARPPELIARARQQRPTRRWAYATALAGVLFLVGFGATAQASVDALPGEPLYAVKRAMEAVRQTVTVREQARTELAQELAERRRAEAHEVQQLRRSAELGFEGQVQAADAGVWTVEGLDLGVAPEVWPGEAPLGQVVRVRAQAVEGNFIALELRPVGADAVDVDAAGYPGPGYPAPSWAPNSAYPSPYPEPYPGPTISLPGSTSPDNPYPGPAATGNAYPGPATPADNTQPGPAHR